MPRPTIKDIAIRLNINPSTVSRALRGHPDVSARLRESIDRSLLFPFSDQGG